MATIRVDIQSEGNARQEILRLRGEITNLNSELARNNQRALTANATQRDGIQERNRAIRAEQGLLRVQSQRQSIALLRLREESGLLANVRAQTTLLQRATGGLTGAVGGLGTAFGFLAVDVLTNQLRELTVGSVQAAINVENITNAFESLGLNSTQAAARVMQLQEASRLPGVEFQQAAQAAVRLRVIGVEGDRATRLITELGNALAITGDTDLSGAVRSITQIIQLQRVNQEEINQLVERSGAAAQALQDAFGSTRAETIQASLEASGQSVQDFVDILTNSLANQARVSVTSTSNSLQNLQNSVTLLQADIGSNFTPVIAEAARSLSAFFDAIRTNELDALPEPIQAIISGAQSLFSALVSVGETIASHIGPEVSGLLPALGGLLGNVLDLAGALVNALRPAFDLIAPVLNVSIALIVKLAEDVGALIGGLADFVNWLTGAETAQQSFSTTTQQTATTVSNATTAVNAAGQMTGEYGQNLTNLQGELTRVNTELASKRQRLDELSEVITSTAHPAYQQLARQVADLETQSATLTGQIGTLRDEFTNIEMPVMAAEGATRGFVSSIDDFGGALGRVDTRFLTFNERTVALSGAIRELPSEITAVRTEFDVLAPTAARVNAIFTEYNETLNEYVATSGVVVINLEKERAALDAVTQQFVQSTQDAEGLAHVQEVLRQRTDAHNAALVNPAVSDAAESIRAYATQLDSANISQGDLNEITSASTNRIQGFATETLTAEGVIGNFARRVGETEEDVADLETTSNRLTTAIRNQTSALESLSIDLTDVSDRYDDLKTRTDESSDAIDEFNTTTESAGGILRDDLIISMEDFETVALRALRDIGDELSAFEGNLGAVGMAVDNLVTLFENPVDFAAGTLGAVIEGLTTLEDFAGPLGVADLLTPTATTPGRTEVIRGGLDNPQYQDFVDIVLGRRGGYDDPIAFLQENAPGLIEQFRPLIDTDPRLGSADIYNRLFPQATGPISSFTRSPDFDVNAEYAATFADAEQVVEEVVGSVADTTMEATEPLLEVFRFTGAQRGVLSNLAGDIETAENTVRRLTDESTPEEVIAAYQGLAMAEQAYTNQQSAFVDAGAGVFTDTALETARTGYLTDLTNSAFDANELLGRALENVGFELVNAFTATSGILMGSALAFQRIPEMAEDLDAPEQAVQVDRSGAFSGLAGAASGGTRAIAEFVAPIEESPDAISNLINATGRGTNAIEDLAVSVLDGAATQRAATAAQEAAITAQRASEASAVTFGQNRLQDAQFGIRTATTEQGFDDAVMAAITATNTYYDAEQTRLEGLGLAEDELRDMREDNQRARLMALFRLENTENPFRRDRLRAAEQEAEEQTRIAERAERERVQAAERAAREQMRILERQQREEQRAIEQRIRQEMRLQDELTGLRDDAVEAEMRRADRLVDIEQDTANRLLDIERDTLRQRQDLQREFADNFRDTDFQFREEIAELLLGEGISVRDINRFFQGFEDQARSQLSESGLAQLREIEGERANLRIALTQDFNRRTAGLETGAARGAEDANVRALREAEAVNLQAEQALTEIQQSIAMTEQETAALASTTAGMEAENAVVAAENLMAEMEVVTGLTDAAGVQTEAGNLQINAAETLTESAQLLGTVVDPLLTATNVLSQLLSRERGIATPSGNILTGGEFARAATSQPATPFDFSGRGVAGGSRRGGASTTSQQPPIVIRNENTLNVDGQQIASSVDENLVRLDEDGRATGSYRRN